MSRAQRTAAWRERQRDGVALITIRADEASLVAALISSKLLDPAKADECPLVAQSGHAENAIDVAFGGKADMPFCTAHVCF